MARNRVAQKFHIGRDGEESQKAKTDGVAVQFRFFDGKDDAEGKPTVNTILTVDFAKVPGAESVPDGVARQALAHGIAQKVGDEYSGSGDNLSDSIEAAQAMIDRLYAGEWLTEREGGSERGNTILREAILRVLAKSGRNVDPETEEGAGRIAKVEATLADKEAAKSWKARAEVKAEMESIKIERAKARLKAAQGAAKDADTSALADFD